MPATKDRPPPSETPPREAPCTPRDATLPAPQPSGPAVVFYRLVCRLAKKPDPETGQPRGYAFAFCKWYAAQFGRTLRTVYEWIRQLRDAGWIETQLDEGVRVFIRPLLPVPPPRVAHTPRPKNKWSNEWSVGSGQWSEGGKSRANGATSRPRVLTTDHSPLTTHSTTYSGVKSGAVAGDYPRTTSETEEKQQREPEKQASPPKPPASRRPALTTDHFAQTTDPVVVLMHQCGIVRGSEARYLAEIPPAALRDACEYTLRRVQKGLNGGAGYTISVARNLATGTWKFPAWYLAELGTAERKNERDAAASRRVQTARPATPKLPIPADWLPGVSEAEARTLVQDAFAAIRNGTGHAPSPHSEVVRDQARLFWQKRNPGKGVLW